MGRRFHSNCRILGIIKNKKLKGIATGGRELTVDEKSENITTGDVIYCKEKEVFSLKNNTDENLSCFVILAPRLTLKTLTEEVTD